jgi:hypothetical protein
VLLHGRQLPYPEAVNDQQSRGEAIMTRTGTGLGVVWLAWTASACDPGVAAASRLTFRPPDGVEIVELHTSALLPAEDSFSIGRAAALLQIGDYLVVGDRRGDPHIIVYDLARGVPIQRLGRRGPGACHRHLEPARQPVASASSPRFLRLRVSTLEDCQVSAPGDYRLSADCPGTGRHHA